MSEAPSTQPAGEENLSKISIRLEKSLHAEIEKELSKIGAELGVKIELPVFLGKCIRSSWKAQAERYRALVSKL